MPRSTAERMSEIISCLSGAGTVSKAHTHTAKPDGRNFQVVSKVAFLHVDIIRDHAETMLIGDKCGWRFFLRQSLR